MSIDDPHGLFDAFDDLWQRAFGPIPPEDGPKVEIYDEDDHVVWSGLLEDIPQEMVDINLEDLDS